MRAHTYTYTYIYIYLYLLIHIHTLAETQAGIKIARRNISNLRYADDTILMAENEEDL